MASNYRIGSSSLRLASSVNPTPALPRCCRATEPCTICSDSSRQERLSRGGQGRKTHCLGGLDKAPAAALSCLRRRVFLAPCPMFPKPGGFVCSGKLLEL